MEIPLNFSQQPAATTSFEELRSTPRDLLLTCTLAVAVGIVQGAWMAVLAYSVLWLLDLV
jgi:hypothetical protein